MPARARNLAAIALTCVTAILLCLAQTASAVATCSLEKTASGNFFTAPADCTGEIAAESLQPQWEIALTTTQTASGRQVWLSADPIGEMGGMNLYAYVGGNPINGWDPFGLCEGTLADGTQINADGSWKFNAHNAKLFFSVLGGTVTSGEVWGRHLKASAQDPAAWMSGFGLGGIVRGAKVAGGAPGLRTAAQAGLSPGEIARIQNAANRIGKPITVVGSRASCTAKAASDWDYVIEGMTNANKNTIKNSLPGAPIRADQIPRKIDFFTDPVRTDLPHVPFYPTPR